MLKAADYDKWQATAAVSFVFRDDEKIFWDKKALRTARPFPSCASGGRLVLPWTIWAHWNLRLRKSAPWSGATVLWRWSGRWPDCPEEDAAVVSFYYLEEMSVEEIVTATGLGASNVKVKLHRSRKRLMDILQRELKQETWTLSRRLNPNEGDAALRELFRESGHRAAPESMEARILQRIRGDACTCSPGGTSVDPQVDVVRCRFSGRLRRNCRSALARDAPAGCR